MRRHWHDHTLSFVSFCLTNSHWPVFIFIQSLVICPHRSLPHLPAKSWPQDFSRFTSSLCHVCVAVRYLRKILLLLYFLGYSEAFSSLCTYLTIQTFLPGGPSASLDSIWERGAGSTCLVCSPTPPNCWKLWLCSSTTGTQPKEAGRRPPTKTQAVFDFPLTSSPCLKTPQPEQTVSALIKGKSSTWCSCSSSFFPPTTTPRAQLFKLNSQELTSPIYSVTFLLRQRMAQL